jgi:2-oxoglutarate dehydrogenase E1 component
MAKSQLQAFTEGGLATVLPETDDLDPQQLRRVVLCSGKVYYELLQARRAKGMGEVAILRVEQLYPFPRHPLSEMLAGYQQVTEIIWCQEEPRNQGAWYQIQHHLRFLAQSGQTLGYAGRPPSASPACGDAKLHREQQLALIEAALTVGKVEDPGERLDDTDMHMFEQRIF